MFTCRLCLNRRFAELSAWRGANPAVFDLAVRSLRCLDSKSEQLYVLQCCGHNNVLWKDIDSPCKEVPSQIFGPFIKKKKMSLSEPPIFFLLYTYINDSIQCIKIQLWKFRGVRWYYGAATILRELPKCRMVAQLVYHLNISHSSGGRAPSICEPHTDGTSRRAAFS